MGYTENITLIHITHKSHIAHRKLGNKINMVDKNIYSFTRKAEQKFNGWMFDNTPGISLNMQNIRWSARCEGKSIEFVASRALSHEAMHHLLEQEHGKGASKWLDVIAPRLRREEYFI